MEQAHRRHDSSDHVWDLITPYLLGQVGQWGGVATDNRQLINAVFWILRTGVPSRNLPPDYDRCHTGHVTGAVGGIKTWALQKVDLIQRFIWLDAHGMPVRLFITSGTTAECTQASRLITGFKADHLLADRGYNSNEIVEDAEKHGVSLVIPPQKNEKNQENTIKNGID